jgi:hypothetical protein
MMELTSAWSTILKAQIKGLKIQYVADSQVNPQSSIEQRKLPTRFCFASIHTGENENIFYQDLQSS